MIVDEFLEWAEQAGNRERARAASAIGKAFLRTRITPWERAAALKALRKLSSDPLVGVRQALAYALADSSDAPRDIVLKLAADQEDIAAIVILRSPILTDIDLIDIFAQGPMVARALVAARPGLSDVVSATLAETGEETELTILLENTGAFISSVALHRIAERMPHSETIRKLLSERDDLDIETRATLIVGPDAAAAPDTVPLEATGSEADWKIFEPAAAEAPQDGTQAPSALMARIAANRSAAPALLLHALCRGRFDDTAGATASLAGMEREGVTAILQRGRFHTVRALFEAAGLGRAMSTLLVEAVEVWRETRGHGEEGADQAIGARLQQRLADAGAPVDAIDELLALAEALTRHDEDLRTDRQQAA